MIFAPAYQFNIYLLCLLGLLRDCVANLHLKLYTRPCPSAGAGGWRSTPTSACRCWPPTWRGWCGTTQCSASTRSGPPTACGAAQSTPPPPSSPWPTTPGCWPRSHIYTYLHNIYAISTQYLHISTQGAFLHFLLVLPFLQEARLVRLLRLLGWLAPGLCVLPYAVYRSYHEVTIQLHTIYTLSAHYLHTICTLFAHFTGLRCAPPSSVTMRWQLTSNRRENWTHYWIKSNTESSHQETGKLCVMLYHQSLFIS